MYKSVFGCEQKKKSSGKREKAKKVNHHHHHHTKNDIHHHYILHHRCMGICKCKNTTDLYCFTHGCHVCERCVADENGEHQKCYVRKYVDYINDSTFTPPVCGHCHKLDADDGAQSPLVRLPCFDVVHLGCLDAAGVEATSAQTPVKCPLCGADVFPKGATRASPIMAALCRVLKDSPWAAALVAGVPSAAPAAPAAPHAKPSIPKATDVPIPPVSSASISLPPPPASSTSPFGLLSNGDAQIELNVTREDDSSSSYAVDKTSGTSKKYTYTRARKCIVLLFQHFLFTRT